MASKAARRKARKQARSAAQGAVDIQVADRTPATRKIKPTARPTAERLAHGVWAAPTGPDKRSQPMVDLAPDMIGALYAANKLTHAQEQAARDFQGLYAAFQADLGVTGYRSCLAGGTGGHDGGDGDEASVRAYSAMRDRIGRVKVAVLAMETAKMAHEKPRDLGALQNALDCFSGC